MEGSHLPIRRCYLLALRTWWRSSTLCVVRTLSPWEDTIHSHISAENVWKLVAKLSFLFTSSLPLVYWGNLIQHGYNNLSIVWTVIRTARWISNSTVGLNSQITYAGKETKLPKHCWFFFFTFPYHFLLTACIVMSNVEHIESVSTVMLCCFFVKHHYKIPHQ